ncbi:MAG: DUF1292 domain-containing protein [Mollicutes bacterium]|jgi:uncharacterized protein YrzB (UPF0473 family)|nr:DUF1292 domain-containing protein [Mollicutes bacterium]
MENERMTFTVIDEKGNQIECEALFTFESEETGKNYIVYTDNTLDEDGNTKVYAAIYNPDEEDGILQPVESDKEWQIIETIFNEIQEEAKMKSEENEQ